MTLSFVVNRPRIFAYKTGVFLSQTNRNHGIIRLQISTPPLRQFHTEGMKRKAIAEYFGLPVSTVDNIIYHSSWKHLP
jgi:hypothetical protein